MTLKKQITITILIQLSSLKPYNAMKNRSTAHLLITIISIDIIQYFPI